MLHGDDGILMSFLCFVELSHYEKMLKGLAMVVKNDPIVFFTRTVKSVADSFHFYCPVIYETSSYR